MPSNGRSGDGKLACQILHPDVSVLNDELEYALSRSLHDASM
jgi:hypothetical protein